MAKFTTEEQSEQKQWKRNIAQLLSSVCVRFISQPVENLSKRIVRLCVNKQHTKGFLSGGHKQAVILKHMANLFCGMSSTIVTL